jgi:hypothetical protein
MANEKQDGSNLINIEFSTGKCSTQCEQCFVNYGQQGQATCLNWSGPSFTGPRQFARAEARRYAKAHPGQRPIYVLGDPPKKGDELLPAVKAVPKRGRAKRKPALRAVMQLTKSGTFNTKDYQMLTWSVRPTSKGFWQIPVKVAREPWVVKAHLARCYMYDEVDGIEHLGPMPVFLRVSSMSDSSRAPAEWLRKVREAWGDQCFFNSAIRTLAWTMKPGNPQVAVLDEYHKLVVTTNPGRQRPLKFMPRGIRVTPPGRGASAAREKATNDMRNELEKRRHRWVSEFGRVRDSMQGEPGEVKDFDFFHPKTLTQIGLGHLEDKVKFYRLRAFPTIKPRLKTDKPVVITQMRFKGFDNLAEFCRRYNLKLEFHVPPEKLTQKGDLRASVLPRGLIDHFSDIYTWVEDEKAERTEAWVSDDKGLYDNDSLHAGEPTKFVYESSYFRPTELWRFNEEPYVCDRLRGGCAFCGLCASLDATGVHSSQIPGLEGTDVPFCNELNRVKQGQLLPLRGAKNAGYIGVLSEKGVKVIDPEGNKTEVIPGDFFATHMRGLNFALDTPAVFEGWEANPAGNVPLQPDECAAIFADVAAYLEKGAYADGYFCEGWNTHENAAASCGFAVWSLMVHAKLHGMDRDQTEEWIIGLMYNATDNRNVLAGADELWELWDDYAPVNDQFGPTSPELLGFGEGT